MDKKIWIIVAVVLGTLVLLSVMAFALFFRKRSKKFSLRPVTPLGDDEFESWRRPRQYASSPEKHGITPAEPAYLQNSTPPTSFEKDIILYEPPRTPSPPPHTPSPSTRIRRPERTRRKSSVASSIADRPPTPYSPSSTSGEFPRRGSHPSRKSGNPYSHYPTMSETSAFNFDFEYSPPGNPSRPSNQSDRPLHYSYARYGESV